MKISEAIKKVEKFFKKPVFITATFEIQKNQYKTSKTKCQIICVPDETENIGEEPILVEGHNFKECLFLLECKIKSENEEDQDDGC